MALPGDATCSEVAACGPPPDGALLVDPAGAVRTIGAALAMAKAGDTVAVAEGTYDEDVVIDRAITLVGVCPGKVHVRGVSAADGAATITVRADATLRGLSISGPARGVMTEGVTVTLAELHVHDTGELAIGARGGVISIRRVAIDHVGDAGIAANGALLSVADVEIHDVLDGPGVLSGYAIYAAGTSAGVVGELSVHRARIHDAASGIVVLGARATVEATDVRRIGDLGVGMPGPAPLPTSVDLDGVVLEDVGGHGVAVEGAPLVARRTTVRRTGASAVHASNTNVDIERSSVDAGSGRGVSTDGCVAKIATTRVTSTRARAGQGCGFCAAAGSLTLLDVVSSGNAIGGIGVDGAQLILEGGHLEDNGRVGVSVAAADATLARLMVQDTHPDAEGVLGDGVLLSSGDARLSILELSDAWIERSAALGLAVLGEARLRRVVVRDTHPLVSGGANGVGVALVPPVRTPRPPVGTLVDLLIERSEQAGVYVGSGTVSVARSVVRDTRPGAVGFGDGLVFSAQSLAFGSSWVAAKATLDECLVESSARAGVSSFGSEVSIARSRLDCNAIPLDLETTFAEGARHPSRFEDARGNVCGCGTVAVCAAVSQGLAPVPLGI